MNKARIKDNELIRKRKKAIHRRRGILFFIFIGGLFALLSFKTDIFYVQKVVIEDNNIVSSEEIVEASGITENTNLLYLNTRSVKDKIASLTYVDSVNIKRKLPNTIVIAVVEKEACYFINYQESYYILDKELNVLEVRKDSSLGLIEIAGINLEAKNPGDKATDSLLIPSFTEEYANFSSKNKEILNANLIDISDILNIKLHMNNLVIKLGDTENLKDKLNKVLNILSKNPTYASAIGYIDVGFAGNPVVFIEN